MKDNHDVLGRLIWETLLLVDECQQTPVELATNPRVLARSTGEYCLACAAAFQFLHRQTLCDRPESKSD